MITLKISTFALIIGLAFIAGYVINLGEIIKNKIKNKKK